MKLSICFYTEGLPFSGGPIEGQSLGGSESALWYMARELARLGHKVDVFCKCSQPGSYDQGGCQVTYWEASDFPRQCIAQEWDLFITCRFFFVLARHLKSKMNWLWLHDMPGGIGQHVAAHLFQTTQVMVLSQFHKDAYLKEAPMLESVLWQTRNGVDLQMLHKHGTAAKNKKRLIYASRPERGLLFMLEEVWPRLLQADPELELSICGYDMKAYAHFSPDLLSLYEHCNELIRKLSRVTDHGALTKAEYYRLLSSAAVMIYPSIFPEISCIAALESMALGVPIVTSDDFALKETIPYDRVAGTPADKGYAERFVQRTLDILRLPLLNRQLSRQGREWVEGRYQWKQVAAEWESRALQLFEGRSATHGRRICEGLLFDSDVMVARQMAQERGFSDIVEQTDVILHNHHQRPDDYYQAANFVGDWTRPSGRYKTVIELLPRPQVGKIFTVLDVGSGDGALLYHMLEARKDIEAVGIDFSADLVKTATLWAERKGVLGRVRYELAEGNDWQPPHLFDVVVAGEIMEHQEDYQAFIAACERYVKSGGMVLITIPSGAWESYSYHEPSKASNRDHLHHFQQQDLWEIFGEKEKFNLHFVHAQNAPRGDTLGWWFVTYQYKPGRPTGQVNAQRKMLVTPPRQTIAACIIAKDEEDNIGRCIKSIIEVVDEIWVWDCGSTDRTMEIVKGFEDRYWPKVYRRSLNTDPDGDGLANFGIWRNQSISETQADWIQWIDCDEVLLQPFNLRRYANSASLFNGYAIRQNHIQIGTEDKLPADEPQRLFRNHRGYQFIGCVHEQPTNGLDINQDIQPALLISDIDIAHYGYITNEASRQKAGVRNLPLVKKDRLTYPHRALGPLLVLRDYVNLSQFELETAGGEPTEKVVSFLRNAILLYLEKFEDPKTLYHKHALRYEQLALQFLGRRGIPVEQDWDPPFEIRLVMALGVGGVQQQTLVPESRWFASAQEFLDFMKRQTKVLLGPLWKDEPRQDEKQELALNLNQDANGYAPQMPEMVPDDFQTLLEFLQCLVCGGDLGLSWLSGLQYGYRCLDCARMYPIADGVPVFMVPQVTQEVLQS